MGGPLKAEYQPVLEGHEVVGINHQAQQTHNFRENGFAKGDGPPPITQEIKSVTSYLNSVRDDRKAVS